jgi:hypothetical protein
MKSEWLPFANIIWAAEFKVGGDQHLESLLFSSFVLPAGALHPEHLFEICAKVRFPLRNPQATAPPLVSDPR